MWPMYLGHSEVLFQKSDVRCLGPIALQILGRAAGDAGDWALGLYGSSRRFNSFLPNASRLRGMTTFPPLRLGACSGSFSLPLGLALIVLSTLRARLPSF